LKHFEYAAPGSLQEAIALLSESGPDALPIAGGTYLLERMKQHLLHPKLLVDVAKLPELHGIDLLAQGLRIGAMVTHTEITSSPLIRKHALIIAQASSTVGGIQIQNLGTIGGNLISCVPSNDSPPPLLALDAMVTVQGKKGKRQMQLEEIFSSPHRSTLDPDEILLDILIPKESLDRPAGFLKFGRRKALTLALVNAAACVEVEPEENRILYARLALGAVAPTPIRARETESFLKGKPISEDALIEASRIAAEEARPIDDFRASANYRRELIKTLTRRVLNDALAANNGNKGVPHA
jgi:CO/xanthine dehydrogenase FAD-binding subunit